MAARTNSKVVTSPQAFILWGDQFEEKAAETFATKLRSADVRTTVVSVSGPVETGQNRSALQPDIALDAAVDRAEEAICVVLPCDFEIFSQTMREPRLREFLRQAEANNAQFVGHEDVIEQLSMVKIHDRAIDWIYDDEKSDLDQLAYFLTRELLRIIAQA